MFNHVAIVQPDGSLDRTYAPSLGYFSFVVPVLEEVDGSWLAWGAHGWAGCCELTRIPPDGARDPFLYLRYRVIGVHDDKLLVSDRDFKVVKRFNAGRIPFTFRALEISAARRVKLSLNAPVSDGLIPTPDFLVEASTDLRTWLPLSTNTATGLTPEIEDAAAPNHPRHFYRTRLDR